MESVFLNGIVQIIQSYMRLAERGTTTIIQHVHGLDNDIDTVLLRWGAV